MTHPAELPAAGGLVPKPAQAIEPLAGTPGPLAAAMARRGFAELTSVQQAVLDAESAGRDLRISSQTGSGKTVAIGLALARDLIDTTAAAGADRAGPCVLGPWPAIFPAVTVDMP